MANNGVRSRVVGIASTCGTKLSNDYGGGGGEESARQGAQDDEVLAFGFGHGLFALAA